MSIENSDLLMLRQMIRCRQFELRVEKLALDGRVRGMAHLGVGQEAIPAAIVPLLTPRDWSNGTYRNVTLGLCLGVPPALIFGELLGKRDGVCGGRGGHMHLFDLQRRFLGTDPVVGAALALGAGAALSLKLASQFVPKNDSNSNSNSDSNSNSKGVSVVFSGEGALGAGISHEVFNLAKLWQLPSLFVIENNGYAISTPIRETLVGTVLDRARSYQIPAASVDGNDVRAIRKAASELIQRVRIEGGPALLECCTYRLRGHSKSDTRPYRSREEEQDWLRRDPIERFVKTLEAEDFLLSGGLSAIIKEVETELDESLREALAMPIATFKDCPETPLESLRPVPIPSEDSEENKPSALVEPDVSAAPLISYRQAIHDALFEALASDSRVIFVGQDVGIFGGAYKASVGLQERFGRQRVIDTPIAELGVCQMLVGAAATGLRPIFEVMFGDFLTICSDAIINHAAKFRFCSNGRVSVPLVIRAPFGAGNGFGATHSQCVERWFAHVPGLKVVVPSTPQDVKSAILSAVKGEDPVLILEPICLYANEGPVRTSATPSKMGARVVLAGSKVTVVSYGRALFATLAACEKLTATGTPMGSIEVIDLYSIAPLDRETILRSAVKTGAVVIVEDGHHSFGLGGEILASVIESGISLRYGLRISGADTPTPYAQELEAQSFPSPSQIEDILRQVLEATR